MVAIVHVLSAGNNNILLLKVPIIFFATIDKKQKCNSRGIIPYTVKISFIYKLKK